MGSVVRREQQEKKGAQGQPAPGAILVPPGPPGPLEEGKMETRDFVAHLECQDLWEPRGTVVRLGSPALLATVESQAWRLPALRAPLDHQEKKVLRDLEARLGFPAPRDQLARMVYQEIQEKEGLLANQAPLQYCLQGT